MIDIHSTVELLIRNGDKLVTAESCTGGLIASHLTKISGASNWYSGGWITYSNEMKISQLGVPLEMLKEHGAVSEQVAKAMCVGALKSSKSTVALSTTGIAGPSGGTDKKPVGTVFIGCSTKNETFVKRFLFSGNREEIQEHTLQSALQLLSVSIK